MSPADTLMRVVRRLGPADSENGRLVRQAAVAKRLRKQTKRLEQKRTGWVKQAMIREQAAL